MVASHLVANCGRQAIVGNVFVQEAPGSSCEKATNVVIFSAMFTYCRVLEAEGATLYRAKLDPYRMSRRQRFIYTCCCRQLHRIPRALFCAVPVHMLVCLDSYCTIVYLSLSVLPSCADISCRLPLPEPDSMTSASEPKMSA